MSFDSPKDALSGQSEKVQTKIVDYAFSRTTRALVILRQNILFFACVR